MDKFLKLYEKSENPLEDDRILGKILNAYVLKGKFGFWSFYNEIQKVGTEEKKTTPPPAREKDEFWSVLFNKWKRNILNNNGKIFTEKYEGHFSELFMTLNGISDISTYDELCNIIEKYPVISKYGIMPSGDRLWNFILSRDINGTKGNDIMPNYRLYINSEASDTYQIVAGFISKCCQKRLPYYLKFIEVPEDYKDRSDSIVIWADERTLFQYIRILHELKSEVPNIFSRCSEPPVLTMKINNWLGFGEEPNKGSYTSARINLLMNSINGAICQWVIENQDRKITYKKSNFSVKQYIAAKSVKDKFDIIKREVKRNPRASITYGIKTDDLDRNLYVKLCCEVVNEVIPTIESNNYKIDYTKNGKKMYFDFADSIYEILNMIIHSNTDRTNIFEKVRENVRLNSKQHGIDAQKFIFNDEYLTRIKGKER